jgi:3-oxoacyl-(acyl-carrier-protein) synthase
MSNDHLKLIIPPVTHRSEGLMYRQDLDKLKPGTPHIYLSPTCHPNAGLIALYFTDHGTMGLVCSRCKHRVAAIAVAARGIEVRT